MGSILWTHSLLLFRGLDLFTHTYSFMNGLIYFFMNSHLLLILLWALPLRNTHHSFMDLLMDTLLWIFYSLPLMDTLILYGLYLVDLFTFYILSYGLLTHLWTHSLTLTFSWTLFLINPLTHYSFWLFF